MAKAILIIADTADTHADSVQSVLENKRQLTYRLNLDREALLKTFFSYKDNIANISTPQGDIKTSDIGSIWVRKAFVELSLEERESETVDETIWRNEWNRSLLGLYHALSEHPWISPLPLAIRAENKLFQWSVAREAGLKLPPTLTSNVKHELEYFCKLYDGQVAFKLLHQDIYRSNQKVVGFYTNKISLDDLAQFTETGENPITVQQYIEKAYEVRWTIVGSQHFLCRIESQLSDSTKIDWRRYDLPKTPHYSMEPPENLRLQVEKLMELLGLTYGALDFIVTPSDEWYFLEVNSMGQWLWIEDLTGLPITAALADSLCLLNQTYSLKENPA
jgi:glutathione synthase/RimK-type ligase-like ATP-grasp enzyme